MLGVFLGWRCPCASPSPTSAGSQSLCNRHILNRDSVAPRRGARLTGGHESDLHRANELVLEARRIVQQQKGLIVRLRAAGADTTNAELMLRFFENNLRRFLEYRDLLKAKS
jgi:hypothetical protein